MEAGEAGVYLFSACAFATLLWHPASPIQQYLPSDAVRRMLMGLAMGATIIAIVLSPVGQAVWSALQSRGHIHVLSIEESGVVGCGVLLRCAIAQARWPAWRSPRLCSRRAGAQSGPLRGHHYPAFTARLVRQYHRVCCRTGHLVYLDERDPVRVQSRSPGALYTLLCRHPGCGIYRFRISLIRYEHQSRPDVRPSSCMPATGTPFGSISSRRPWACWRRLRFFFWPVKAKLRIARSCITTTTSAASSATRDRTRRRRQDDGASVDRSRHVVVGVSGCVQDGPLRCARYLLEAPRILACYLAWCVAWRGVLPGVLATNEV